MNKKPLIFASSFGSIRHCLSDFCPCHAHIFPTKRIKRSILSFLMAWEIRAVSKPSGLKKRRNRESERRQDFGIAISGDVAARKFRL